MYVEDKYHYEEWEVDNGDGDVSIISIVNDFFKIESWHTELIPFEFWVNDGGMGYHVPSDYDDLPGSDYDDCINWIKENYLNAFQVVDGDK